MLVMGILFAILGALVGFILSEDYPINDRFMLIYLLGFILGIILIVILVALMKDSR